MTARRAADGDVEDADYNGNGTKYESRDGAANAYGGRDSKGDASLGYEFRTSYTYEESGGAACGRTRYDRSGTRAGGHDHVHARDATKS